ncbi:MAG: hypothetical protein ACQESH_02750 [Campylobacterota bacterium]
MIKLVLFVVLSAQTLLGVTLLNQNLYERDNRVDLMLSFDSEFEGRVSQQSHQNGVAIILSDVVLEAPYQNELNHPFLQSIAITQVGENSVSLRFVSQSGIDVLAAKTSDGYGLRLRVVSPQPPVTKQTKPSGQKDAPAQQNPSPTQEQEDTITLGKEGGVELTPSYIITVSVLLVIAVALFIVKRKLNGAKESWLIPKGFNTQKKKQNLNIKFQKVLDSKNKVVLMEFEGREYLTLIGNSNILLDSFADGEVVSKDGFEEVFERNKQQLNDYFKLSHEDSEASKDSFKANAERV